MLRIVPEISLLEEMEMQRIAWTMATATSSDGAAAAAPTPCPFAEVALMQLEVDLVDRVGEQTVAGLTETAVSKLRCAALRCATLGWTDAKMKNVVNPALEDAYARKKGALAARLGGVVEDVVQDESLLPLHKGGNIERLQALTDAVKESICKDVPSVLITLTFDDTTEYSVLLSSESLLLPLRGS